MSHIAITSNQLRHREFISRLQKYVDLSMVIVVDKKPGNAKFCLSERRFFGHARGSEILGNLVMCTPEQVNSRRMKDMISEVSPDLCFVFGAPLLKKHIFSVPSGGCINIHTGLVQHHRGVDSPYWALYEGKPEEIGATIHYINSSIDKGRVIAQSKTEGMDISDTPEDIFMRTCITGFDILEKNVYNIINNSVEPYHVEPGGKLYQLKDMNYGRMLEISYKTPILLKEYLNGNNS